jgi:acetyltransferase
MDSLQSRLGPDVALFRSPDRLARAVSALVTDAAARSRLDRGPLLRPRPAPRRLPSGPLDEDMAKQVLAEAGIRMPARVVCHSRAEAEVALATLGAPVVVKVLDADVAHKSDVGGVHVNVRTLADLHAALASLDAIGPHSRYLVEEQAPPGPELIVGGLRDPSFGPTVLLALGGVALFSEPILRLAPLHHADAVAMVQALPPALLAGYRGAAPVDVAAVADVIRAVADILTGFADVAEIDVNPVRLTSAGPLALDAWIGRGPVPTVLADSVPQAPRNEVLGCAT